MGSFYVAEGIPQREEWDQLQLLPSLLLARGYMRQSFLQLHVLTVMDQHATDS